MRTLKVGTAVNISEIKIAPIEEVNIQNTSLSDTAFLYASKKPYAIVIVDKEYTKIIDVYCCELPIDSLINEVRGLREFLNY